MKRIYVDMDGTLTKWTPVQRIEELYEPGFFLHAAPQETVLQAVRTLARDQDAEVYILSAVLQDSPYARLEKDAWLDRYLPEVTPEHRLFSSCGEPKAGAIGRPLTQDDLLLDDYTKNLLEWQTAGGSGVKLLNGVNHTHKTWQGPCVSVAMSAAEMHRDLYTLADPSPVPLELQESPKYREIFFSQTFSYRDLSQQDFSNCQFINCSFRNTNLEGADFSNADFCASVFTHANMEHANLNGARIEGCDFWMTQLRHASFQEAVLTRNEFLCADLRGSMFTGAVLADTKMTLIYGEQAQGLDAVQFLQHGGSAEMNQAYGSRLLTSFGRDTAGVDGARQRWARDWFAHSASDPLGYLDSPWYEYKQDLWDMTGYKEPLEAYEARLFEPDAGFTMEMS